MELHRKITEEKERRKGKGNRGGKERGKERGKKGKKRKKEVPLSATICNKWEMMFEFASLF